VASKAQILDDFAANIHAPYLLMAGVLALLSIAILLSPLPDMRAERGVGDSAEQHEGKSLFQFPHVWFGALAIFFYVGAEVMAGDAIGTYGRGFDIPLDQTKYFTSGTLAAMLVGYVVGFVLIPRFVSQQRYLAFSAALGIVLVVGAFLTRGYASVGCVAALGFANAMMWPAIFPLAIHGLGRLIERGSALLIMGIAGGAIIPQAFAMLRQSFDFQAVFLALMIPCYAYIGWFALRGHRSGSTMRAGIAHATP
jgi:glucose/galactose transporter